MTDIGIEIKEKNGMISSINIIGSVRQTEQANELTVFCSIEYLAKA